MKYQVGKVQSQSSLDDLTDWGFVISDEKSKPLVSFGYVDKKRRLRQQS